MSGIIKVKTNKINARRYPELDALRGIAVLGIILYHYTIAYDYHFKINNTGNFHFKYGFLAVELFFIISGFVIFLTLENSKKKTDFLVSRFSRLYPAYWCAIFLTASIITLFPVPTLGHYSIREIAENLTMFQGFDNKVRLIDQVYWTLKFELTFYIIMYLLYLTKSLKNINLICIIWLALSLSSRFYNIPGKKYLDVLLILQFAPLFIAGISFYKLKMNNKDIFAHILVILSLFIQLPWIYKMELNDNNYIVEVSVVVVFYATFYLFIYKGLILLNNKFLLFFGTISYSLYLLHNVIGYSIIYRLRAISDTQIFYVSISFIIVVILASMVSFFVEKPAMKLIRNWYKVKSVVPPQESDLIKQQL